MNKIGKANIKIKANHHPLKKAKQRPATHIDKDLRVVPIFSPIIWVKEEDYLELSILINTLKLIWQEVLSHLLSQTNRCLTSIMLINSGT